MSHFKKKYIILIVSHYPDRLTRVENLNRLGIFSGSHYDELHCSENTKDKIDFILKSSPNYYIEDAPHIIRQIISKDPSVNIYVPINYKYSDDLPTNNQIHRYKNSLELLELIP